MKKTAALLCLAAALLAACSALRSPRIAAQLSYTSIVTPPDEAFRATPPPDGPLETTPAVQLQSGRLPNGVELVLVERHDLPLFSAYLAISRGARDIGRRTELLDFATTAALREHESSSRANPELRPSVDCGADECSASVAGLSRSLPAALGVLADLALRPRFQADHLGALLQEWRRYVDMSSGGSEVAVEKNVRALLFPPNDPYAAIGPLDRRALFNVSTGDLALSYSLLFQPQHATLIVAGDVTLPRLQELAQGAFGAWTQTAPVAQSASPPPYPGAPERTVLVEQRAALVHAYLIARGPIPTDPTFDALSLFGAVLDTPSGALFAEVRSSMNATYDVHSSLHGGRVASWFSIGGSFELAKAPDAVRAILAAIRTARDQGVNAVDLEGARTRYISALRSDAGTTTGVTEDIAGLLSVGRRPSDVLERPARIARLTAADVQTAAKTWLSDAALRLVIVGPRRSIERRFDDLGIGAVGWRSFRGEMP
ncbi:MAG: pitrilysin family protein [Polyangiaceae bacterium]